ncbi:MAG: hypothetical protein OXI87_02025 [Albidovulum sp.]|nr:hypothetical protein [Albidovulum sp.]MDE0303652.1 hypothetical protein [Albidovulum sp.]MDE0533157.1 hypothetical protein [Albidovulum sp.]
MNDDRFAGRFAIAAGGARGIGFAIAKRLAAEDATTAIAGIDGKEP